MGSLYVSPEYLTSYPSSVDWNIIPKVRATPAEQLEAQTEICQRATAIADRYVGQVLQASFTTEGAIIGDGRLTVDPITGNGVFRTAFCPIVSVVQVSVSPANLFPANWNVLSSTSYRPVGTFAQAYPYPNGSGLGPRYVQISPGYVTHYPPSMVQLEYVNGFPHCMLTAPATEGDLVLQVDDVVGFAGATGYLYDAVNTELAYVTSLVANNGTTGAGAYGPGTLNLQTPLDFNHNVGVLFSCFGSDLLEAVAMIGIARTMMRGSTALVMAALNGQSSGEGGFKAASYLGEARKVLKTYMPQK